MRVKIIINPRSGLKQSHESADGSRFDRARRWAASAGVDAEIALTRDRGHAAELARQSVTSGIDRVIAWGGDGTVNETAGALFGTFIPLGIVPGGSGDGLAGSLRLPRDPEAALLLALTGQPRRIDVGWLGDRHFVNVAGVGFDAAVARQFNLRTNRGARGYIAELLRLVWSYECEEYRIDIDGGRARWSGPQFVVAFANGREYGSRLVIAPEADLSDGSFDMVLLADGSPLRQLWRCRRLAFRRMAPAEGVWRDRVRAASIEGERLCCHVDGETFEAHGKIELRIEPGALRIIGASG